MKKFLTGILSGILAVTSIGVLYTPSVAESVSVLFNSVRVSLYGQDIAQWGENYTLANGETVPYSILHKGTTYLPLRKIGELTGKKVGWNGDTNTVYLNEEITNEKGLRKLVEKPDKNGNVWTYYLYMSELSGVKSSYGNYRALVVRDEKRGFERVYQVDGGGYANFSSKIYGMDLSKLERYVNHIVKITDDEIIFVRRIKNNHAELWKIDFLNDENTQDGEPVNGYPDFELGICRAVFWDKYMFCIGNDWNIYAVDMEINEIASSDFSKVFHKSESDVCFWVIELIIDSLEKNGSEELPVRLTVTYPGSSANPIYKSYIVNNDNGLKITEEK